MLRILAVAALMVLAAGCSADAEEGSGRAPAAGASERSGQKYPDVVDVTAERTGETFSFDVTMSSPYDTPERYADGWRIVGPGGTVYGEHTLAHDHANEQPFTRTQSGVEIPDGVDEVTVEGHDTEHGYGGGRMTVPVPR